MGFEIFIVIFIIFIYFKNFDGYSLIIIMFIFRDISGEKDLTVLSFTNFLSYLIVSIPKLISITHAVLYFAVLHVTDCRIRWNRPTADYINWTARSSSARSDLCHILSIWVLIFQLIYINLWSLIWFTLNDKRIFFILLNKFVKVRFVSSRWNDKVIFLLILKLILF